MSLCLIAEPFQARRSGERFKADRVPLSGRVPLRRPLPFHPCAESPGNAELEQWPH